MCGGVQIVPEEWYDKRPVCRKCGSKFPENFPYCLKCGAINPENINCEGYK